MIEKSTSFKSLFGGLLTIGLVALFAVFQFNLVDLSMLPSFDRGRELSAVAELDATGNVQILDTKNVGSNVQLAVSEHNEATLQTSAIQAESIKEAVAMMAGPPCDAIDCAATGMPFTIVSSTPPGVVTTISPTGNIAETTPTYVWNEISGAGVTAYKLLIYDRDAAAEVTRIDTTPAIACATTPCELTPSTPTLTVGTRYLWRIKAMNSAGWGEWSTPRFFDVAETTPPPGMATLISPNGDISETSPTYTWQDLGTADSYEVLIYDRDVPAILDRTTYAATTVCNAGSCSVTPSSPVLTVGTRYLWRVKAINSTGTGPWSTPLFFTIVTSTSPPSSVTLIAPEGDTTDELPTYEWQDLGTADSYEVLIYDRDVPAILDRTTYNAATVCASGTCSVIPSSPLLTVGTRYLWRVKGINSGGLGPWSAPMFFDVVTSTPPPDSATAIAPQGDITESLPTYEWQDLGTADSYEVLIYDRDVSVILDRTVYNASTACTSGTCSITPSSPTLVEGTRYLWRVKGINSGGLGPWSDPTHFKVVGVAAASTTTQLELNAGQLQIEMVYLDDLIKRADTEIIDEEVRTLDSLIDLLELETISEEIQILDDLLAAEKQRVYMPFVIE